jgi:membrane protease YdiL (CAAX protease family)
MTLGNQTDENGAAVIKPWGRWATVGLGLLAMLVGQIPALAALIWWSGLDLAQLQTFAADGVAVILNICISTPVYVALLVLMARQTGSSAADYLGLRLPRKRDLVIGVIAVVIFIVVSDGINWLLGHDIVSQFQLDISRTASAAGCLTLLWLTVVVVAPIGEEILFRGFLFRGWHRSPSNAWPAIIMTAVLWTVLHVQYDLYLFVQIFMYGLLLGWFRWMTGSTILTMVQHGLINFAGMLETFMGAS